MHSLCAEPSTPAVLTTRLQTPVSVCSLVNSQATVVAMGEHALGLAGRVSELQVHGQGEEAERAAVISLYQGIKSWSEAQDSQMQCEGEAAAAAQHQDSSEASLQGDSSVQDAILLYAARLAYQLTPSKQSKGACGLPLSNIASVAGSNLFDLFRDWPVVSAKLAPYLEQHLGLTVKELEDAGSISEWQKSLVAMALLSKKYKDLFNRYLHSLPEHKAVTLKMGWVLYLVLKAKLLPKFPDLVSCMEVLVCVINLMVAHLDQLPLDMVAQGDNTISTLNNISDALKADRGHVQHLMLSVNALFTQQLQSHGSSMAKRHESRPVSMTHRCIDAQGAPRVETNCSYFPGLLSDSSRMTAVTTSLEREYMAHFQRHGEIDELDMLYMDFARFASPRMTPSAHYKHNPFSMPEPHHALARESPKAGTPYKGVQMLGGPQAQAGQRLGPGSFVSTPLSASAAALLAAGTNVFGGQAGGLQHAGMHSPLPLAQLGTSTATPISAALGSTAWLRHVTALLKAEPSPVLLKYFAACVPNPAAAIARRVKEMTDAVLPSDVQPATAFPMVQPSMMAYRREEAIKLYYHVLELVMASEERVAAAAGRAQQPCYTTLLTSSKLHKGLMVCSLEVVMACYKMVSCPFPKVLDVIKLHAFDLIKIVQTYVRHMPGMPLELKRHLYLMEEKTVESLAWQAGSSLYSLIITAMGNTGATSSCTITTGSLSTASDPSSNSVPTISANTAPSGSTVAVTDAGGKNPMSEDSSSQALSQPAAAAQPGVAAPAEQSADANTDGAAAGVPPHAPNPSPSKRHASSSHSMMSPLKKARGQDSVAITTQPAPQLMDPLPAAVGRPPAAAVLATLHPETAAALTWLHDFLRKVLKLAWFRLGFLCQSLHFGPHDPAAVRQKVYDTVEHALYMHTNLLYNRHLDQLLLSALYGYCKVQHLGSITFKEIIAQYRRQPQATQAVFRSVVLAQTNPGLQVQSRGDIIAYYNQAFVPLMKQYLLRGEAAAQPGTGLPPIPPSLPPRQSASPRVGGSILAGSVGHGGASPRLFQPPGAILSPVGSPSCAGRPPLPPQPACDAIIVNQSIKHTINGFFPTLSRAGGTGRTSPRQSPEPAGTIRVVPNGPPPRWPDSTTNKLGGAMTAGGLPFSAPSSNPAGGLPPPRPVPTQEIPSGIATLLRALDTANGVLVADDDKESSQEEGVQAPPQHSPQSGGRMHGMAAEVGMSFASPLCCVAEQRLHAAGGDAVLAAAQQQGSVSPDAASSDTRGLLPAM